MSEEYKQVANLPYLVNRDGVIYSIKSHRKITPQETNCGYMQVRLYKNNKVWHKSVHRIVAEAFVPNPHGKEQVNHIDGDKKNNKASNLEWATRSENQLHRYRVLNRMGHNPSTKEANNACRKPVCCIETGIVYGSITEAARKNGGRQPELSKCLTGKVETFKGVHWAYA